MSQRLSRAAIFRLVSLQSIFLGLFASSYLLYAYVAHRPIVCGASGGCELVRLSKWAYVFGTVPRPLLGVLFYGAVLLVLLARSAWRGRSVALWRTMQLLVAVGLIESVVLFFIQWREIGAFCLWCLLSAGASVELALCALFDRPVEESQEARSLELRVMVGLMALLSTAFLVGLGFLLR